jgi:hypothetical protein
MVLCFATMMVALSILQRGGRRTSLAAFSISMLMSLGLFLFEIYSPSYGFRMPWLQW